MRGKRSNHAVNMSGIQEQAKSLAWNLASSWIGACAVLDRLAEAAGDPEGCPWAALERLGDADLERLFADGADREALERAEVALTDYMSAQTMFDRAASQDPRL